MKKIILKTFLMAVVPLMPLLGLTYDVQRLNQHLEPRNGTVAKDVNLYNDGIKKHQYIMNAKLDVLTFLDSRNYISSDLAYDPEYLLPRLENFNPSSYSYSMDWKKFQLTGLTFWNFKDNYILASIFNKEDLLHHILVYDIKEGNFIDITELAKNQGFIMYLDPSCIGGQILMNDSGDLVGSFFTHPHNESINPKKLFTFNVRGGLKVIEVLDLGPDEYLIDDILLNNKGQFTFSVGTDDDQYCGSKKYLYEPIQGVHELKNLETYFKRKGRKVEWEIVGFNDNGHFAVVSKEEFANRSRKDIYHFNQEGKLYNWGLLKCYFDEDEIELTDVNFNNKNGILYGVTKERLKNSWPIYHFRQGADHIISFDFELSSFKYIYGMDDEGRIIGKSTTGKIVVSYPDRGSYHTENLEDLLNDVSEDSPFDFDEVENIFVQRNGSMLIQFKDPSRKQDSIVYIFIPETLIPTL